MGRVSAAVEYVDLHAHTTESDGTLSPEELVALALETGISALAITDHDTFAGYESAAPAARAHGFDLVRGIELNSRLDVPGRAQPPAAHLLAYFPVKEPAPAFFAWLGEQCDERRERNRKLAAALQRRNVDITLEEVEARGRSLAGRTHFAQLLLEKGYVNDFEQAFARYLGEDAPTHVERQSQSAEDAIARVREGGGIPVLAHPVRLGISRVQERPILERLKSAGLLGLEVYHSDHSPELQAHYHQLAMEFDLAPTGGSDFHGAVKPQVQLGTGINGNVRAPRAWLETLRGLQLREGEKNGRA